MDIRTIIRNAVKESPESTVEEVVNEIITTVEKPDFAPLVEDAVLHAQRDVTRSIEKTWRAKTVKQLRESRATLPEPTEATAALMDGLQGMLTRKFALGTGQSVRWGEATIEQHLQRIAMLMSQREGIDATIARHEEAIAIIERSGRQSLDEVYSAAA